VPMPVLRVKLHVSRVHSVMAEGQEISKMKLFGIPLEKAGIELIDENGGPACGCGNPGGRRGEGFAPPATNQADACRDCGPDELFRQHVH
jgi:hypothetical protein